MPSSLKKKLIDKVETQLSIELDENESYLLHELCGIQLQADGFDQNDQPTAKGLILEGLIDKLYR